MGQLDQKAAIVTGGTRGIGRAIAERFIHEGAKVVVAGRSEPTESFAAAAGDVFFCRADVSKSEDVVRLVDFTIEKLGRLDVLVNNAGVEIKKTIEHTSEEEWDHVMGVNMKGVFLCSKYAIPVMRHQASAWVRPWVDPLCRSSSRSPSGQGTAPRWSAGTAPGHREHGDMVSDRRIKLCLRSMFYCGWRTDRGFACGPFGGVICACRAFRSEARLHSSRPSSCLRKILSACA